MLLIFRIDIILVILLDVCVYIINVFVIFLKDCSFGG